MPQDRPLSAVCVFCGSSPGQNPEHARQAAALGQLLAQRGIRIIYGAGHVGLMGVLADAALASGGEVIGVIPQMLVDKELAHRGLTELRIVSSMHERKALMAQLADAFIALPGGLGTYEELFEVLTWAQLGIYAKPCGCLSASGYFDPLRALLEHAVSEGFLPRANLSLLEFSADPAALLDALDSAASPRPPNWPARDVT